MARKNIFDELDKIPDTTELDDLFSVKTTVKGENKVKKEKVKSHNMADMFNDGSDKDVAIVKDIVKSIANGKYTNTNLMDVAEKLGNLKEKKMSQFTKLLTILSLYTGNDKDFAELQTKCGYEDVLTVQKFYEQLYNISLGNYTQVSDFTRVVYDNSNLFIDNLKRLATPSINDYIKRTQFDRRNKDANLLDQFFSTDNRGVSELKSRELMIPKGISPYEIESKTGYKYYDTVCAVPKAFYKKNKLDPKLYGVSDSPLIRSRKTRYQLFTQEEQVCENMDYILDSLSATFNTKINIVDYQDEINGTNKEYKFYKKHAEENEFKHKGQLYVKRSRTNYSNASDVRRNAEGKVSSNDNEMVAYSIKALANNYFDKDKRAYRAKIAHNIAINGGFCNINKKAKHFYPFIRECASIMATRMVLYSINLDGKDKNVNFKLDQGLEFALVNKLASFPDLKAKWVLPSIKGMAKYFAFEYYKKANISPKQVALGMERARHKVDQFRDIPASIATVDDYSKVLFGTFDLGGSFEMQNIIAHNRTRESFDIFDMEDEEDQVKVKLFEELTKEEPVVEKVEQKVVEPAKDVIKEKSQELQEKEIARTNGMNVVLTKLTDEQILNDPYYASIYNELVDTYNQEGYSKVVEKVYGEDVAKNKLEANKIATGIVKSSPEVKIKEKKEEKKEVLLLPYTAKEAVKQRAREDFIRNQMYPNTEELMYVDEKGVVSFKLPSLKEKVEEEVIILESDATTEEEIEAIKEVKFPSVEKTNEELVKTIEQEIMSSEKSSSTEIITKEVVEAKQEVGAVEGNTLKLPKNLTSKLKKDIPQMFNSYLQKFKLNIEKRLDVLLESVKDKNITPRKKELIDANKAKLEYVNKVIFNYLETNSALAKINKFSNKKVMDNDKLFDKIINNHEDMIIYMVQKQLEDKTNEIIVGVNLMIEKNPQAYNGYSVKRLVNEYAEKKGLDLKTYASSILVKYSKGFDWSRESKTLTKVETKSNTTKTKVEVKKEVSTTTVEKEVVVTKNVVEKGEHSDGK